MAIGQAAAAGLMGAASKTMPLCRLLGKGRHNPFRPGGQPTYRDMPFPQGTTATGVRSPTVSTPGGTTYNPQTGGYGTAYGGATRGAPYVNRPLMDPRLFNAARPGALNPQAHPARFGAAVAGAGLGLPWLMRGGGDDAAQLAFAESGIQQWQPPVGIGSYAEYEAEEARKISQIMKTALQQYMVLSFTAGPEAAKTYLEMVDKIIEQGRGSRDKTREAKIYDAVFGDKNNLPKSSEQVFNRITTAGGSPQYASEISGYVGEAKKADVAATGRVSQGRQVLDEIRKVYVVDKTMGAERLVAAWQTGLLKPLPIGDYEMLTQKAHETLSGTPAGELAGDSMVSGIRVKA